jgi:hypothetical protein
MKIKQILLVFIKKITAVIKGRQLAVAAIVATFSAVVVVAAVLTPSFGILSAPVFVRASFADTTDLKFTVRQEFSKFRRGVYSEEVIDVTNYT